MKKIILMLVCLLMIISGCSAAPSDNPSPSADYSEKWRERPLPESFDLRSVDTDGDGKGDRCYVTPVRLQNPFGTCWGFAAVAAAEISILGHNLKNDRDAWKTLDLSEKQLAYFTNVPLDDPANPQNGEGFTPDDIHNTAQVYDKGGSAFLATSTFAQGIGPSYEYSAAYGDYFTYRGANHYADQVYLDGKFQNYSYAAQDDWTIPEQYRFKQDYSLLYSHMLPSPAQHNFTGSYMYYLDATNLIKEELLDKRGVMIAFCADTSLPSQDVSEGIYIELNNWAHYTWADNAGANHAVTIIGWDDNYPRENLIKDHMPPDNGAWLVKNSWGSGEEPFPASGNQHWGIQVPKLDASGKQVLDADGNPVMVGSGYFWLSYYDKSLTTPEAFGFKDVDNNLTTYQHDYLSASQISVTPMPNESRMANVFTARKAEAIDQISCITGEMFTSVDYAIYLLPDDFVQPDQGLLVASGSEVFEFSGFHSIPLLEPVCLQAGQKFSVIMTVQDRNNGYIVNTPQAVSLKGMMAMKAIINERESFLFADGEWYDYKKVTEEDWADDIYSQFGGQLYYDNFPIKVYTTPLAGNMNVILRASESVLSLKEGKDKANIRISFRGHDGFEVGNPKITWQLLPGSEDILSMEVNAENTGALVTAKALGTGYIAATAEGIGTSILAIKVAVPVPTTFMPILSAIEYTGEPVTNHLMAIGEGNVKLNEGEDYTLKFSNNVKCGIATIEVCDPDGNSYEPAKYAYFAIQPKKAQITSAKAGSGSVQITVGDQWSSGISGYQVEYSPAGKNQWTAADFTGGTTFTLKDLSKGSYDIRVHAFVDTTNAVKEIYNQNIYYGDYSDVQTVTVR